MIVQVSLITEFINDSPVVKSEEEEAAVRRLFSEGLGL